MLSSVLSMKDQKCHLFLKNESIFASGCNIAIIASVTSAIGTGPSPTWQSNTKHYNFFKI